MLIRILIFIVILYLLISIIWPILFRLGAAYTPTPKSKVRLAMELAKVGPNDIFYDLGCGTGTVLIEAKKRGAKVVGIEIDPLRWLICKLRLRGSEIILGNMYNIHINDATVVFIYQWPSVNEKLKLKLESELKSGTRVISYQWEIKGWKPSAIIDNLYLYIIDDHRNS